MSESENAFTTKQAGVAATAVVIGALLGGSAQVIAELVKDRHEREQVSAARAEEIMTIVEKAPWLYTEAKKTALQDPTNMSFPPYEPERVYALVALYFPRLLPFAKAFEDAGMNHYAALQEIGKQTRKGLPPDPTADNATFGKLFEARDTLSRELQVEFTGGPSRVTGTTNRALNLLGLLLITVGGIGAAFGTPSPQYQADGSVVLVGENDKAKRLRRYRWQKALPWFLLFVGAGAILQVTAIFVG
jgi:hypothetical protein